MSKKNNNNWQDLEREEKHYKEDRSSTRERVKRPYKRDRNPIEWADDGEGDDYSTDGSDFN